MSCVKTCKFVHGRNGRSLLHPSQPLVWMELFFMENLFKKRDMIINLFFSLDLSRTSLKAVIQDLDDVLSSTSSSSLFTSWVSPRADQSWCDKAIVEAGPSLNTWLPTMSDKLYPLILIKQSKYPTWLPTMSDNLYPLILIKQSKYPTWLPTIKSLLLSPTTAPRRPRLPLRPLEVNGGDDLKPLVVEGGEDRGLAEGGGP